MALDVEVVEIIGALVTVLGLASIPEPLDDLGLHFQGNVGRKDGEKQMLLGGSAQQGGGRRN